MICYGSITIADHFLQYGFFCIAYHFLKMPKMGAKMGAKKQETFS